MKGKTEISREQSRKIKSMNREQIGAFIFKVYKSGYEDGQKVALQIKPSDIAAAISGIKGVGTKKTAEIMEAVNNLFERGTK